GHVGRHYVVTGLGHTRRFGERPLGACSETEKTNAKRIGDLAQLREVRVALSACLVKAFERRARELELPARLKRDGALTRWLREADDVARIHDRLPAEQIPHALKQRADATVTFVRDRQVAFYVKRD